MIICSCNRLTDTDVRRLASAIVEPLTAREVYDYLNCNSRCGRCAGTIGRIMKEASAACEHGDPPPAYVQLPKAGECSHSIASAEGAVGVVSAIF